jgi:hypothetical protein
MNNDALIKDCLKRLSDDELNAIINELGQPTHDLDSPLRKLVNTIYGEDVGIFFVFKIVELTYPLLKETQKRWQRPPISQKDFEELVDEGLTELIGEGKWIKDSAYQVFKYGERYFVWVVYDSASNYVLDDSLCEIEEENIGSYLENWKK